jgi:hypothetical protein
MVALATVAAVVSIGSSLLGAFGKKKSAKAQEKAFKLNAKAIEKRGEIESILSERKFIKGIGATKADIAGAGLTLGGSAGDLLREAARDAEFELQSIQSVTKMEAEAARLGSSSAKAAGNIGGAASLLGAVGPIASLLPKKG